MRVIELPEYGPRERAALVDGESDPSGVADLGLTWRDKEGHVGLVDGDRLVAHAGWLPIELRAGDERLRAVGLGGVLVHRDWRSGGAGATVVRAAMERMRRLERAIGLLFCHARLVPFYERLGWRELRAEVTVQQPETTVPMPLSSCWLPLSPDVRLSDCPIDLEGPPF